MHLISGNNKIIYKQTRPRSPYSKQGGGRRVIATLFMHNIPLNTVLLAVFHSYS